MENFAPDPSLVKAAVLKKRKAPAKRTNLDELLAKATSMRHRILNDYVREITALSKQVSALRVQSRAADGTANYGRLKRELEEVTAERALSVKKLKKFIENLEDLRANK